MKHPMKDGSTIEIENMDDNHLINTIQLLRKKAKEGVTFKYGGAGMFDEPWYDEETYFDEEALEHLNFDAYMKEASKRKLSV